MIVKMELLLSSMPLFNARSNCLTYLERSFYYHFIKRTASDLFLAFLCAATANLASKYIQWTAKTF